MRGEFERSADQLSGIEWRRVEESRAEQSRAEQVGVCAGGKW